MPKFEKAFVSNRAGISFVDFLADEIELSKAKIKDAMAKGAVWLKRGDAEPARIRRAKEKVLLHDEIHIYYDTEYLSIKTPRLECIADEGQYSIWSKPSGFLEDISLYGDHLSFERAIERDIPHDRDCYFISPFSHQFTGLFLVVHSLNMASHIEQEDAAGGIEKSFEFKVDGKFPQEKSFQLGEYCLELTLIDYQSYSDRSLILLKTNASEESDWLNSHDLSTFFRDTEEELFCTSIGFKHPSGLDLHFSCK